MQESRLAAGRDGRHGLQIMSFEQAAVRLAGGFARPIDDESLRAAIQAALPATPMGELESIKALPGMIDAAADTLHKAWRAGIDLAARSADHPRLAAIARLEAAVLDQLPPGMMRPLDIVTAATARIGHATAVLGPLEIVGLTELSPCWRPLLQALTAHIPVRWTAGPRSVPAWLDGTGVTVARAPAHAPGISAASAATAYHEAIEAMRWARSLLASGIPASEIAIATASPADYDDHFLALRADANIDLHFVHGVRTVATREGQAAAALADIVVRGLSQSRLRRLAALCRDSGPFETLPEGWLRVLPTDAPLSTPGAWNRLLDPADAGRLARRRRPRSGAAHSGRDPGERTGRRRRDRRSLPQGPRARDLAQGSARRPRRLDRRHAGNPEAGRRTGSVRLRRLDAGQRARGIAPPLRAAPRA